MYRKFIAPVTVAALAVTFASSEPASAQWVRAGVLGCDVSAGWGFIIGSTKSVSCLLTAKGVSRNCTQATIDAGYR